MTENRKTRNTTGKFEEELKKIVFNDNIKDVLLSNEEPLPNILKSCVYEVDIDKVSD